MIKQGNSAELEEAPSTPAIGEVIAGKYRVESVVGTGGMGIVLCATHLDLGQKVAIKVLTVPDDDARRDEARERFLREGRATAALVSDHVVRVYDVGTLANGAPFMVMELLRGQDLARTLQQCGPLSVELSCDCVRQAADAIACAHAQGIVHRDLKPSNLFLTQRSDGGTLVKVLDFGISKSTSAEREQVSGDLTLERSVLGTPFYMSPEQVRDAKNVDVRTDIWSLGLILHELLSGSPAFEGTTLPGVCAAITADPPAALRLKRPDVPLEVEAIVLKCLEKDPARRFQTARELVDGLAPWTGRSESGVRSPLSDATIRSSALSFELAELRDGSTVALLPPDTGTLASAVFTKSDARALAAGGEEHPQFEAAQVPALSSPRSAAVARASGARRRSLALGGGAVALLACAVWMFRSSSAPAPETTRQAASSPAPASAEVPAPSSVFSVQIDSNPVAAQVYEADRLLGSTPLRISIDSSSVAKLPRTFTIRKPGFTPYTLVQGASAEDTRVLAELVAEPTPTPTPARVRASVTPLPKKSLPSKAPRKSAQPGSDIFMQR